MTPFEGHAIDQEQRNKQASIADSMRLDGTTDASLGANPQHQDAVYLDGYFAELRRRVESGEHLEIRWLSPAYLMGAYDAPDYIQQQEF